MYNGFYICPKSKKDWFIWSLWLLLFIVVSYYSVVFLLYFCKFYNLDFSVSSLYTFEFLPLVVDSHFGFYSVLFFLCFFALANVAVWLFFHKVYLSKKNKFFFLDKLNKVQSADNKVAWKNYLKNFDNNA